MRAAAAAALLASYERKYSSGGQEHFLDHNRSTGDEKKSAPTREGRRRHTGAGSRVALAEKGDLKRRGKTIEQSPYDERRTRRRASRLALLAFALSCRRVSPPAKDAERGRSPAKRRANTTHGVRALCACVPSAHNWSARTHGTQPCPDDEDCRDSGLHGDRCRKRGTLLEPRPWDPSPRMERLFQLWKFTRGSGSVPRNARTANETLGAARRPVARMRASVRRKLDTAPYPALTRCC